MPFSLSKALSELIFLCNEIQIENGKASFRQPHSRPTEKAASPGKKQTAAKSAV